MKKIIFIAAFLILSVAVKAQNVRLDGMVTDIKGIGLEMANVMAVNKETKAMDSYSITNDKGKFQLNLKANTAYLIKISYIGFKAMETDLNTTTENSNKIFALEEGEALNEVEIVREMPVSIKGDTIVYNSDSFTTGTERKLEDILKKLPGVEVNADGEVEVEGKKVSKLMVEGKDFFDGDTKLGVKNIPADAIDKIQVLRNYNEIGALKNVENNEDNVAMNIKLKSGKKNFWFGDMTAGAGPDERYIVNPKLFYYNPSYSINLITNFNNIGELPLTIQDYFKFTGGFRGMMRKGGSSFNVSSNDLGISLLRNNRAKEIETRFGATNFSYNVTKAWTLSGFAILSSSLTDMETKSRTTILASGIQQNSDENSHQKSELGLFKFSSSFKPNSKFQWDYDILGKLSKQNENTGLFRELTQNGNLTTEEIATGKKQSPTSINQNFSMYYTQSEKNVFALEIQHLYQDEDPFYNLNLGENPFPNSNIGIIDQPSGRYVLDQERFVKTNKIDTKLDYYYMLTPKSNINVTFGNTYSYQTFDSSIFQTLDNQDETLLNPNTKNNVSYTFKDAFLGLHYKFLSGKFTFTPGFSLHAYDTNNEQSTGSFRRNFIKMLPDFYALYQIKKSETLTYNFSITNDFTDINQLAEGYLLSGYSNLFRGLKELGNAHSQSHSLRYFKYSMFNMENISANLSYSRRIDAVRTNAFFDGFNQSSIPYNSQFADESVSAFGSYGRSFLRFYKASVSANVGFSKNNNRQNDEFIKSESFTQNYTLKASTNYKKLPNLEVGYNLMVNQYQSSNENGNNSKFYTHRPFARLDYYFLNAFSFVSEYEFYHYYNDTRTAENEYDFLTASLIYQKKGSKWEYKVSATNLLNTTSLNDDGFTQFATRTSQYKVQPRYLIFSLKYNL